MQGNDVRVISESLLFKIIPETCHWPSPVMNKIIEYWEISSFYWSVYMLLICFALKSPQLLYCLQVPKANFKTTATSKTSHCHKARMNVCIHVWNTVTFIVRFIKKKYIYIYIYWLLNAFFLIKIIRLIQLESVCDLVNSMLLISLTSPGCMAKRPMKECKSLKPFYKISSL